ncbi:MAG: hypothetical protein DRP08_03665 [Candidatus Aenigmatarchaeota archaeon]|nr:MAG: hypothetical protein DRP08_03665 [Candidatus Aenigmarchaeota archaeon]
MELSMFNLKVLSALAKSPLATVKALSRKAGVSPTLSLRDLGKKGVFISISAEICHLSLILKPFPFFFNAPFRNLDSPEVILDLHSYVRYGVRCIGSCNGIYVLFAVPDGALTSFLELVELLKEMACAFLSIDAREKGAWSPRRLEFPHTIYARD